MNSRKLWILVALFLAGCGGSNEPTAADGTAGTEPEVTAADAVPVPEVVESLAEGEQSPTSDKFRLGVEYARLSPTQPTSSPPDKVEVAEVFWYGCPHCFNFDSYIERWRPTLPEYATFVRVPAVWNPLLQFHARAFYTAEALGKGEEMHSEFFREIHERGNALDTEDKLQAFFGRFGVDAATFKSTFDSVAVHTKLQRADELSRRYRIGSVPTMIVNGKYTTDGTKAGNYEALLELVNELAAAEHAGR